MDLIYTSKFREELGVLFGYELDLAFGADENDFECTVTAEKHVCENGSLLFFEGTEYGGMVDSIESNTATDDVIYSGRTWHGMLNSKVLEPDAGKDYLVLNGEANAVLASLVQRMGLTDLFGASTEDSGITIKNYKMNRYILGYDGIMKMLASAGGKLKIAFTNGVAVLSAHPVKDYTKDEEFDSDLVPFTAKRNYKSVNHLVCLGSGELASRLVVHLYADEQGNISHTQTFTGLDEITSIYEYSQISEESELIAEGMAKFKELLATDEIVIDFDADSDEYDVGDIIGAVDNVTGLSANATIKKKILVIKNGQISISLEPDTAKSGSTQETIGGGGVNITGDGATFTPSVDADGNLSWTNDKGLSNPETVNIKGEKGDKGEPGENGATFTPSVDAGGNLSWTNDKGLGNPATVNIKGEKGDKGEKGNPGSSGSPHNLLDNSDFRNPVMQAGFCGNHGSDVYIIDRWQKLYGVGAAAQASGGITLTGPCYMMQKIDADDIVGKTFTMAVKLADGTIVCGSAVLQSFETYTVFAESHGMYLMTASDGFAIRVVEEYEHTVVWAALYEGSYTAETLPEYQPKGYAAEMMECMRYYRNFTDTDMMVTGLVISSTLLRFVLPLVMPMRVAPTVIYNGMTWLRAGGTNVSNPSTSLDSTYYRGSQIELNIKQPTNSVPYNNACVAQFSNGFALSADL